MAEKTEPPTPKKIRDARKKGQILFSQEIVSAATIISVTLILASASQLLIGHMKTLVNRALVLVSDPDRDAIIELVSESAWLILLGAGLAYGAGIIASLIANLSQVGAYFNAAKIKNGLKSLNAIANAQNMFSKKSLFGFLMNVAKVGVISLIITMLFFRYGPELLRVSQCSLSCALETGGHLILRLVLFTSLFFVPLAAFDFLMQRHFHLSQLRMSKEEVKQEFKESEGNPEIKSQRRQIHQDILNDQMLSRVRKSSVVVANPTHYAVALWYDSEKTALPVVSGKGEGSLALMIRREAHQAGVPIYENPPLAQDLFRDAELDNYIPAFLIEPVAAALRYVAQARGIG